MADLQFRRYPFKAMGSFCELQFYFSSRIESQKLVVLLTKEVERLEAKYSRYRVDSYLQFINNSAGKNTVVKVDNETASLLNHALNCFEQSDGLFDITSGALRKLWNFKAIAAATNNDVQTEIPSAEQVDKLLTVVGFDKIQWNSETLVLPLEGMELDFGGLVKEYAADCVSQLAKKAGIEFGLVNLGGDFSIIGPHPNGKCWKISIKHPRKESGTMAQIDLCSGALATSGDYERYFVHHDKRYSHILNPKTGWPNSGLSAVSIVAEQCALAGSVATIAMLKEEEEAIKWLREINLPHLYMTNKDKLNGSLKTET